MEPFIRTRRDGGDESVAAFVRRRLGAEAAEKIAGPLLAGIHAGDPEKLSIWSTFPRLPEMEREHGSIAAGIRSLRARAASAGAGHARPVHAGPPFTSFRGGIRRIVDGIAGTLRRIPIQTGRRVTSVERAGKGYRVRVEGHEPYEADACVVAIPAGAAAAVLGGTAPKAAEALRSIRYASSATVFLGYDAAAAGPLPEATGFLIPATEGRRIFGCTFVSNKFEGRSPDGKILIRVFVGGALDEEAAERPDGEILTSVREELAGLIGIRAEPIMARIGRWPKGNPQYEVGHGRIVETIDHDLQRHPGLIVTGSAFRGVGIPDGVTLGKAAAENALAILGLG